MKSLRASAIGAAGIAMAMGSMALARLDVAQRLTAPPIILPSEPALVRQRTPGKTREGVKTLEARRAARRCDPYYGIAGRGRNSAVTRQAQMAAALAKRTGKRGTPIMSNPFTHDSRRQAFDVAMSGGVSRQEAMKVARRVSA